MNTSTALLWAQRRLDNAGIGTSRLDSLVLLEDATGIDRARLLAYPEQEVKPKVLSKFKSDIGKRVEHFPLAYIRQKTEFYGREFLVNESVLEPRPESETLIEELGILIKQSPNLDSFIDIGTGSGALAITAKLEHPKLNAYAVDISEDCLAVATTNAASYDCQVNFILGDLLEPVPMRVLNGQYFILANLPYVPENWQINPPAMHEPAIAIFGGKDGLELYRRMFKQIGERGQLPLYVLTESMPPQHEALSFIAHEAGFNLLRENDFIQVFSCSEQRQA